MYNAAHIQMYIDKNGNLNYKENHTWQHQLVAVASNGKL